jgi:DNA transformation protein
MSDLSKAPNIGKVLEQRLKEVHIDTYQELKDTGSKEAYKRIREIDPGACINMLCALEGAIQGIRWHSLSQEKKDDLKMFINSL